MAKTAKWVIFKGDNSLDALCPRLWERLKVFWTSHMSGYLMEPIRFNEDFKEVVRNIKNTQKGGVQNILSLSHNPGTSVHDCRLFVKSPFCRFLAVFDVPEGSFEVLIICDWFHKVP